MCPDPDPQKSAYPVDRDVEPAHHQVKRVLRVLFAAILQAALEGMATKLGAANTKLCGGLPFNADGHSTGDSRAGAAEAFDLRREGAVGPTAKRLLRLKRDLVDLAGLQEACELTRNGPLTLTHIRYSASRSNFGSQRFYVHPVRPAALRRHLSFHSASHLVTHALTLGACPFVCCGRLCEARGRPCRVHGVESRGAATGEPQRHHEAGTIARGCHERAIQPGRQPGRQPYCGRRTTRTYDRHSCRAATNQRVSPIPSSSGRKTLADRTAKGATGACRTACAKPAPHAEF